MTIHYWLIFWGRSSARILCLEIGRTSRWQSGRSRYRQSVNFIWIGIRILQKFFLYILQSQRNRKYYVGTTKDTKGRLNQHNRGVGKSTRSSRPWRLIYTEEYNSRSEAVGREKRIKNQKSRSYIENLLRLNGCRWKTMIGVHWLLTDFSGAVVQLGERLTGSQKVTGSTPVGSI